MMKTVYFNKRDNMMVSYFDVHIIGSKENLLLIKINKNFISLSSFHNFTYIHNLRCVFGTQSNINDGTFFSGILG